MRRGCTKQVTVSKAGALGLRRTLPRGLGLLEQRAVLTGARERALQHGRELAREARGDGVARAAWRLTAVLRCGWARSWAPGQNKTGVSPALGLDITQPVGIMCSLQPRLSFGAEHSEQQVELVTLWH